MIVTRVAIVSAALLCLCASVQSGTGNHNRKALVAHRGASAYAPEHTLASYTNDEMADVLYRLGVDALFTDNPDQFPRR